MKLMSGIKKLGFEKTYTLPFSFQIPNSTNKILKNNSSPSSRIKYIKRNIYLKLKRQNLLESNKILDEHHNILWINISAPSIGDSLMDLSSRVMLSDRNIDLFTDKKNADIYLNDDFYDSIFTKLNEIGQKKYDLVILDSYSTRTISIKAKISPLTPFVAMFGYYNGPEVNRVLFSFHQMNNLLGCKEKESDINIIAEPSIFISNKDKQFINSYKLPQDYIAIVIGGEWSFRTFDNWDLVIEKLMRLYKKQKIILIGSDNGTANAKYITKKLSMDRILNFVAKFSFNQTAEIINKAKFTVCCDGGLMHAAHALGAVTVPLLAKLGKDMQLTYANNAFYIYDELNVNNITIESIVTKCEEAINFVDNNLQDE